MSAAAMRQSNAAPPTMTLRTAALDLLLVLSGLIGAKQALLSVEALWNYAGPISLLLALSVAHWRLRVSKESWGDLGLQWPVSWPKIAMWTLVALVATTVAGAVLGSVVEGLLGTEATPTGAQGESRMASLPGNPVMLIYWLAVAWVIGGFVEELLFRAYLITRLETLFKTIPFGVIFAVIIPAAIFGQQHFYYQGLSGAVATGAVGLVSGAFYIWLKRGLLPLILSHGLANTVGLTLIYAGIQAPA